MRADSGALVCSACGFVVPDAEAIWHEGEPYCDDDGRAAIEAQEAYRAVSYWAVAS